MRRVRVQGGRRAESDGRLRDRARSAEIVGEGWHRRSGCRMPRSRPCGLPGAQKPAGATLYVTLEPCCHQGKTPPCTRAVLAAGAARVVAAMADPFPQVAGGGLDELRAAGVEVQVGVLKARALWKLNAPYLKLLSTGKPWIVAKWAMTLDGKIATRTGDSRWISSHASRTVVHQLRGRMDAIIIGRGTAAAERSAPDRSAAGTRNAAAQSSWLDSRAQLSPDSANSFARRATRRVIAARRAEELPTTTARAR